eukprot:m.76855 g.76855  ORF g.76855 m.76855 type:complete len:363 (+) comp20630_c0_seq1:289-1377(+)
MDYFEGPEKLLEIWFEAPDATSVSSSLTPSPTPSPSSNSENGLLPRRGSKHPAEPSGLRALTREQLQKVLDAAKVTVLSSSHNEYLDAYVLSESSMFVAPYRFILKTCGRSTLLPSVPVLLDLARTVGLNKISDIFYSRKNFGQPEEQLFPHKNFGEEVSFLDDLFANGAAYALGRINGDHWYLYTLEDKTPIEAPDQTMEVLMSDLDPAKMAIFYKQNAEVSAKDVTKNSGIQDLFPSAIIDEHLFDPCGYSMNGLYGEYYFTIHVTPQNEFSYVSFETDVILHSYTELLEKVLAIFQPGRFTLTVFANKPAACRPSKAFDEGKLQGYKRKDKQLYQFEDYSLNFGHFLRADSIRKASTSE